MQRSLAASMIEPSPRWLKDKQPCRNLEGKQSLGVLWGLGLSLVLFDELEDGVNSG